MNCHLRKLAENADILDEIEDHLRKEEWRLAQDIVKEAGIGLASAMGRDSRALPYSFFAYPDSDSSTSATEELRALQALFEALGARQLSR